MAKEKAVGHHAQGNAAPSSLGYAEPQERKPPVREEYRMDVAGVLLYTTSCLAAVFYVSDTTTRELPHPAHEGAVIRASGGRTTRRAWRRFNVCGNARPGPSCKQLQWGGGGRSGV